MKFQAANPCLFRLGENCFVFRAVGMKRNEGQYPVRGDLFGPVQNRSLLTRLGGNGANHRSVNASGIHRAEQRGNGPLMVRGMVIQTISQFAHRLCCQCIRKGVGVKVDNLHSRVTL